MQRWFFRLKNVWITCGITLLALTAGMIGYNSVSKAKQAPLIPLGMNECYSDYDLNGDGKKEKLQLIHYDGEKESSSLFIYVNRKLALTVKRESCEASFSAHLITLANGKVYLSVQSTIESDDANQHIIYELKKGKYKKVTDIANYNSRSYSFICSQIEKVAGNQIYIHVNAQPYATGIIEWKEVYGYKSKTIKKIEKKSKLSYENSKNKWTVKRTIKVHKKAGKSCMCVAFTLKRGDKVKINRIQYKDGTFYLQIKNAKGKTGWMKSPKQSKDPTKWKDYEQYYFKEAHFAG